MLKKLIPNDADLLEIAPGPGYLSIELAMSGINRITGLDISESFVRIADRNAKLANLRIDLRQGNASTMPFRENEFTHIICTSAFKNFSEPLKALEEMHRVLIPKGIVWLCDMRGDVTYKDIDKYVDDMMKMTGINGLITKLTFKYMLR